ncbi:hypothetical protein V8E55_001051 [Tylopilus felleus]
MRSMPKISQLSGVQLRNLQTYKFYLDHNLPFGIASAASLQGEVAGATLKIWKSLGVGPSKKWVNDISVLRFSTFNGKFLGICNGEVYHYDYDLTRMKELIAPLGVPWHQEKGQTFKDTVKYLSFLWNLPSRSVTLTSSKHCKYIIQLELFLTSFEHTQVPKEEDPPLKITISGLMPHQALVLVFFGTITGTAGELLNLGEVNLVKAMTLDGLKQLRLNSQFDLHLSN